MWGNKLRSNQLSLSFIDSFGVTMHLAEGQINSSFGI